MQKKKKKAAKTKRVHKHTCTHKYPPQNLSLPSLLLQNLCEPYLSLSQYLDSFFSHKL